MELVKLWTAVLRRKLLLLQAIVFFTAVGAVAALTLPKAYEATAKVIVSSSDATSAVLSDLGLQEVALGLSGATDEISNHIALSVTRPVLDEVIWKLQLRDEDGLLLQSDKLLIPGLTGEILVEPLVEVKQQQGTDIVLVTAATRDEELSRLLADTVAEVYIKQSTERTRKESRDARAFVDSRLELVRKEFDDALGQIADAKQREQVLDLEAELKEAVDRLSSLMMDAESNAARIREIQAQADVLRTAQSDEDIDFMSPATVAANPDIRTLRETWLTLKVQRQAALVDKTPRHPDVQRIDLQIQAAESALALLLDEQHNLDPAVIKLRTELAGLVEKGAEINDAIARTTERFSQYPQKMRTFAQLEMAANAAQEVYRSLQSQSYEIAIAEALAAAPLQMVEPARAPDRPARPKVVVYTIIGFGLGVLVGLGLVFLFEFIDDSVRTDDDVAEIWAMPRLGVVPKHKAGVGQTIASLDPTEAASESFRALRSALSFASPDRALRRVMVTSSLPGEGKSTVLVNLAVAMAQDGHRVLIVDGDMRRPTQHRFWAGLSSGTGLTQVLLGEKALSEVVQDTGVPGLSLLAAGPVPPDPGRLVESQRFRQVLDELSGAYDRVLIDAPPALVVNDALVLAGLSDGVIFVVESAKTGRRVLADAQRRLSGAGLVPLGYVLNKMQFALAGYGAYEKAYRTYTKGGAS